MGCLVAEVETQLFFGIANACIVEAEALQAHGALLQPVVLHHAFDHQDFGGSFGIVFGAEAFVKFVEMFGRFAGQEHESAGESVADGVYRDSLFAFGRLRTGRTLRIDLIRRGLGLRGQRLLEMKNPLRGGSGLFKSSEADKRPS